MTRIALIVAGLGLSLATVSGAAVAQETNADGGYSVADPGNSIVADEGEVETYGDIATGGSGGEVVGDPAGLASIPDHAAIVASVPPPVLVPEDDPAPAPVPAPPDSTTTTTTSTTTHTGEASTPSGTAPAGTTAAPAPITYCGGYATWYDAQVAYETAGGLSGDPALVQAADPDYDGVACEELIVY